MQKSECELAELNQDVPSPQPEARAVSNADSEYRVAQRLINEV
jgi:hypothetical protein